MAIIDTHKVFENLTDAGFDEAQAKALVGAVSESHDSVATKADLQAEIADMRGEVQSLAQKTEVEFTGARAESQAHAQESKSEFAKLRAEMQAHAQENKAEFASLRAEIQALAEKTEADIRALEMRMTIRLGTMIVIVAGAQTAFLVFLLALLGVIP